MIENTESTIHATQQFTTLDRRHGREAAILTLNLELEELDSVADELLKEIRERIRQRLRASDVVVQLEGNEFVVLLKDIRNPDNADSVSHDLIEIISQPFELTTNKTAKIDSPESKIKVGISFFHESSKAQ